MTKTNNRFLKAAGLMMAVMMLATCVISGTMAKYTSSQSDVSAKASVAKWSIQDASTNELGSLELDELTFNIYDTDGATPFTEENVSSGKIAPGTWGYTTIELLNKGDVDADIEATIEKGSLPTGMKLTVLTEEPGTDTALTISEEKTTVKASGVEATNGSAKIVIAYVWEFGDGTNDVNDMTFASGDDLTLGTLSITANQVD